MPAHPVVLELHEGVDDALDVREQQVVVLRLIQQILKFMLAPHVRFTDS